MVLTDARWVALAPLAEACRPHAKVPPSNLRRAVEAIVRRCRNGARWRAVPAELGPWWMAAQTLVRWTRPGVRDRLLERAQERGVEPGMTFLDGTNTRAHAKAAGAARKGHPGRAATLVRRLAEAVEARAPRASWSRTAGDGPSPSPRRRARPTGRRSRPRSRTACRGYSSHTFREVVRDRGAGPAIPTRRNEAPVAWPAWACAGRNRVERPWGRLEERRAVATRYEKTARSFTGVLCLAASLDWLRR